MDFFSIFANLRIQDFVDIVFLTVVAYHLHLWFRGTKAFKALVGLLVLGIIFTMARTWGLFLTTWVFQILWQVLIILLIILFQSEIRQVLERVNPLKAIGFKRQASSGQWIPGFAKGIFSLAGGKVGALVILERSERVDELITGGQALYAEPTPEVLLSIFQKDSPLHDGAVLIRDGQISLVGCYLPLSSSERVPVEMGTRHRAALGLAEKCDAWVVAVSEERGKVSLARRSELIGIEEEGTLAQLVGEAVRPIAPQREKLWKRIQAAITHQWPVKAGSLVLVTFLWLLLAGQQDFEVTFQVPLEMRNVPKEMQVLDPIKPQIRITARGLRKDASTLSERNVHATLDLSLARFGRRVFPITRDQIFLPNDRIQVVRIEPAQLSFKFKESP
ncbi:MAG: diadenylate cyclase [Deltaproteobacteria bacterium]|nr:diadenylate cyclase [Deltaproteobacteria bacterium]